jgi:hypothetical protein
MHETLPIVSAEASFLTKLLSYFIFALAKLKDIVTAKGRPSGMATTTTVIEIIIESRSSLYNLKLLASANANF